MMKHTLSLGTCGIALSLVVAACGGEDSPDGSGGAPNTGGAPGSGASTSGGSGNSGGTSGGGTSGGGAANTGGAGTGGATAGGGSGGATGGAGAGGTTEPPPAVDGECDCTEAQACTDGFSNEGGGFPQTVHRCVDIPASCGATPSCDCLPYDPCFGGDTCQGGVMPGGEIDCGQDVMP